MIAARFWAVGWHYAAHFTAVRAAFYATARVNAARFFSRWCKRYEAHYTAVGAAFYTNVMVSAARFCSVVGVAVTPPIILPLVPPFTLRRG